MFLYNYYYMSVTLLQPTETHRKYLYITIDERTPENDKGKVIISLEILLRRYEREAGVSIRRYYFYGPWCKNPDHPYCRPQYYIENCRDRNGKINANCIFNLSRNEPWQQTNPHYDIYIIDKDIIYDGNPSTNFLFGATIPAILSNGQINPGFAGSVLSIGILKKFYGLDWWETAFSIIAAHELGHLFGLPNPNSQYYIGYNHPYARENRLYANHCSYEYCAMRQINAGGRLHIDLLDLARNIFKHNPYYLYCKDDWEYLIGNLRRLFG